ncbi:hypothetical protein WDW89_16950 [Deltaproteobacteria bacterium TL4]
MDLEVQGLSPDNTVADGGLGLRSGQAIAWPNIPCFGDVFHGLQEMTKVVTRLEKRAYKAMTYLNEVEKKMLKAKLKNKGRSFSTKLAQVRLQEKQTIEDYDTMNILTLFVLILNHTSTGYQRKPIHFYFLHIFYNGEKL